MNELKANKIIDLENERRKFFIYDRVGIDYPKSDKIITQIQQLKKEIMDEHNLDEGEVEEHFKNELLYTYKIAKAVNDIYVSYLNEYDDLTLIAWKSLTNLKDLLYSQLLTETGKEPFEMNLSSLSNEELQGFQSQYEQIVRHLAHAISYKKLILLLRNITDAPLLDNLFKSDDFEVIDDITIAAEGLEAYMDDTDKYEPILSFRNLRKFKDISSISHTGVKNELKTKLDIISKDITSTYPESEKNILTVLQESFISILETIAEGIEDRHQALAIIPKYTNFANSNEFKTIMGISKGSTHPFNEFFPIKLGRGNKDIVLNTKLSYEEEPFFLNIYDSIIYSNISTLREAGNTFITVDMIYRKMNGFNDKQKASDAAKRDIIDSIERMKSIKVTADYRPLAEFKRSDADFVKDEDVPILYTWKRTQKINGVFSEGYVFPYLPIFYETAQKIKHVQNIDDKYLNLSHDGISDRARRSNTRENTIINTYIIQRVEDMKANKKLSKRINIDTVCEKIAQVENLTQLDRHKKKRIRNKIFDILEIQKENGLIKGYEGKGIGNNSGWDSVEITF